MENEIQIRTSQWKEVASPKDRKEKKKVKDMMRPVQRKFREKVK